MSAMSSTWLLRASQWLPPPPDAVFPFFADAANLQALTPPWLSFAILTPQPIAMRKGVEIDYRLRVHGLPLRWRSRIDAWDPPRRFVDVQLRGPYSLWHHEHRFEPERGGTRAIDEVRLRPRGGPFAPLLFALFVRRDLNAIFSFRRRALAERFGADATDGELELRREDVAADHGPSRDASRRR